MDATKAELERTIRVKRAGLDEKLTRLGVRLDHAKHTSQVVGLVVAGLVVLAALAGATAILVRAVVARRR